MQSTRQPSLEEQIKKEFCEKENKFELRRIEFELRRKEFEQKIQNDERQYLLDKQTAQAKYAEEMACLQEINALFTTIKKNLRTACDSRESFSMKSDEPLNIDGVIHQVDELQTLLCNDRPNLKQSLTAAQTFNGVVVTLLDHKATEQAKNTAINDFVAATKFERYSDAQRSKMHETVATILLTIAFSSLILMGAVGWAMTPIALWLIAGYAALTGCVGAVVHHVAEKNSRDQDDSVLQIAQSGEKTSNSLRGAFHLDKQGLFGRETRKQNDEEMQMLTLQKPAAVMGA